jgi:hypothetical protein
MNIKLGYQNLWSEFDFYNNIFLWLLQKKHNVIVDMDNPDIILSGGGMKKTGIKTIYFSSEPYFPTTNEINNICDFSMSGYYIDTENYYRFPLYLYYIHNYIDKGIIKNFDFFKKERKPTPKNKFCNFICRSFKDFRGEFVTKLNKYKNVDVNVGPFKNINVPGYGGVINCTLKT